jgi:peptidylprolyl isomerase
MLHWKKSGTIFVLKGVEFMTQADKGKVVKVHYTGKFEDGSVFSASPKDNPLEFKIGEGRVIPGFENAVIGMEPGQVKTATIPASQGYGQRDVGKVQAIERSKFPPTVKEGEQYEFRQGNAGPDVVTITQVTDDRVMVDGNHPLAGRDLTFDIELLEVD